MVDERIRGRNTSTAHIHKNAHSSATWATTMMIIINNCIHAHSSNGFDNNQQSQIWNERVSMSVAHRGRKKKKMNLLSTQKLFIFVYIAEIWVWLFGWYILIHSFIVDYYCFHVKIYEIDGPLNGQNTRKFSVGTDSSEFGCVLGSHGFALIYENHSKRLSSLLLLCLYLLILYNIVFSHALFMNSEHETHSNINSKIMLIWYCCYLNIYCYPCFAV